MSHSMAVRKGVIGAALAVGAMAATFADAGNWKVPRWWAFLSAPDAVKKVVPSFFSFLAALIKAFAAALVNAVKSVI